MASDDRVELQQLREQVGRRIRLVREAHEMTVTEFSRKAGISLSGLWNIERGLSYCNYLVLNRICAFATVSADYLLQGKDTGVPQDLAKWLRKREHQHTR